MEKQKMADGKTSTKSIGVTEMQIESKSVSMPQLVECRICGMNTRTEWTLRSGEKVVGQLWACSYHKKDIVWNAILTKQIKMLDAGKQQEIK